MNNCGFQTTIRSNWAISGKDGGSPRAEDYEWSCARAQLAGQGPQRLLEMGFWHLEGGAANWR